MNPFGYYVILGVTWIVVAAFQLDTVRMLPSSMKGFKIFGMLLSILNLGLATSYFVMALKVRVT